MPAENRASRVDVFQAENETLREHYFFLSPPPLQAVIRRHCGEPPAPIRHWKKGEAIYYREIEADIDSSAALQFLKKYVEVFERTGAKVRADRAAT